MSQKAKDNTPDSPPGRPDPALAGQSARRRVLGDRLRAYYDAVASEPVPDAFADLLNSLAGQSEDEDAAGSDKAPSSMKDNGQDRT